VLKLEVGTDEEGESVEEKDGSVPLYKGNEYQKCLLLGLKTCLFPRNHSNGTVGLPTPVLMRIP
jgi:hypothetical protein